MRIALSILVMRTIKTRVRTSTNSNRFNVLILYNTYTGGKDKTKTINTETVWNIFAENRDRKIKFW